jgi:sugar/nucleoside kinase (ribokinase family)
MFNVVALGELLIDFTPSGKSSQGNVLFETNPGGAPANVLATLARLGKKTAFIGKVGQDQFGEFLGNVLVENSISAEGLVYSKEVNTTLAFVHLDPTSGDRSFSFYRKPGADTMLTKEDVKFELLDETQIFHFGSLSLTNEPVKSTTFEVLKYVKEKKKIISYDPNLRPALWSSLDKAKETIIEGLKYADILKISEEELLFITGTSNLEEGTSLLVDENNIKLLFVTLGEEGCFYRKGNEVGIVAAYKVNAIDTTGAGDSFFGTALSGIIDKNKSLEELNKEEIEEIVKKANKVGAFVTTKAGAIPAIKQIEV